MPTADGVEHEHRIETDQGGRQRTRSGRVRLALSAAKPLAMAMAMPLMSLNAKMVAPGAHVRAMAALASVNAGP